MEESLTKKWYAVEKYQLDLGQIFPCRFSIYDTCGNVIILCSKYEKMNELNIGGCFYMWRDYGEREHLMLLLCYRSTISVFGTTGIHRCIKQLGGGNAFSFIYI